MATIVMTWTQKLRSSFSYPPRLLSPTASALCAASCVLPGPHHSVHMLQRTRKADVVLKSQEGLGVLMRTHSYVHRWSMCEDLDTISKWECKAHASHCPQHGSFRSQR